MGLRKIINSRRSKSASRNKKSESNGSRSKSVGRGHLGSNFGFCQNIDKETISRHDLIEKDIELLGVRKAKLGWFLIFRPFWLAVQYRHPIGQSWKTNKKWMNHLNTSQNRISGLLKLTNWMKKWKNFAQNMTNWLNWHMAKGRPSMENCYRIIFKMIWKRWTTGYTQSLISSKGTLICVSINQRGLIWSYRGQVTTILDQRLIFIDPLEALSRGRSMWTEHE